MMSQLALMALLAAPIEPEARQALFARLKQSIVVLELATVSGERAGNGTGFVLREDGLVVTNHHVVDGHPSMSALFADGRRVEVTGVLALDAAHDLAVVRIAAAGLAPLSLGTSTELKEGAQLFMAGNPRGLDFTFNEGVLTALRPQGFPLRAGEERRPADTQPLLQLSIGAEPGSSGSPVVDAQGRVVGVMRAVAGKADFAVPVEALRALLTDEVLASQARPLRQVPWWNLLISLFVITATGFLILGRRRRGSGVSRSKGRGRLSGYEE
jgi:S1-C subfamily serine protease